MSMFQEQAGAGGVLGVPARQQRTPRGMGAALPGFPASSWRL